MVFRPLVIASLALGILSSGCPKKADGNSGAPEAGVADASGLASQENHPGVMALAKAAAHCPHFDTERIKWIDPDCAAAKAWSTSDIVGKSANDPTLLNLLEDEDPSMRWLAASALYSGGERWGKDPAAAKRVLGAVEKEKNPHVEFRIGLAAGMIDLKRTGLEDRVVALVRDQERSEPLRSGLIGGTLQYNDLSTLPVLKAAIEDIARKDKDPSVRTSAITDLWMHKTSVNCPLFLELLRDPNDDVASSAARACTDKQCASQVDEVIAEIAKRASAGTVSRETFAYVLGELGKGADVPPARRKRLIELTKAIVQNDKNSSLARGRAIEVLATLDPTARAFIAKYTKDSDVLVAAAAKKAGSPADAGAPGASAP